MKHISPEHSQIIMRKLCKAVGADYDTFDFSQKEWFRQHEWTQGEEDSFVLWLADFLEDNKYVKKGAKSRHGQRLAEYESSKFVMNVGWKTATCDTNGCHGGTHIGPGWHDLTSNPKKL